MSECPKIAVIGSNSFSGAAFIDLALKKGSDVIGISRSEPPHDCFLPCRWTAHPGRFRFHRGDLNTDLDAIMAVLTSTRPSHVVNFAAQSMVAQSWEIPEHWFQTNVVATVRLHDRLRRCDFLEKYVHVSTPEVYGSTRGVIGEDTPFNPSTPYAVSRAAADMSLRTFFDAHGFPVVSTRAANIYGPGQSLYRLVPRTILLIRTGRKLQLHGGGASRRCFIHGADVMDATWRIMIGGTPGETYHISGDEVVSVRDLVERLCGKLGVPFEQAVEMAPERLGKDDTYALDSTKLKHTLGWRAEVTLDRGLDDCIAWVDRNLDVFKDMPEDYVHKP